LDCLFDDVACAWSLSWWVLGFFGFHRFSWFNLLSALHQRRWVILVFLAWSLELVYRGRGGLVRGGVVGGDVAVVPLFFCRRGSFELFGWVPLAWGDGVVVVGSRDLAVVEFVL
jgi:hypothetical protein